MPGLEQITYELDNRSVLKAILEVNAALERNEKTSVDGNERISQSFQRVTDFIGKLGDKQFQANERLVQSIERRAAAEGRSNVDRLVSDRDRLIKKLGDEEKQIERVRAAYDKLIKSEQSGGGGGGGFSGLSGTIQNFVQRPFQMAGLSAKGFLESIGPVGAGLAAAATTAVGLSTALYKVVDSSGEAAQSLTNLSASTGISVNGLDRLQAMAKITGVDISSLARAGTTMATTLDQGGAKAKLMLDALQKLGVSTVDYTGKQKDEGVILEQTIGALSRVTDQNQRLALAAETLGPRVSKNLQALLVKYKDLDEAARQLGFGNREGLIKSLTEAEEKINEVGLGFTVLRDSIAGFVIDTVRLTKPFEEIWRPLFYLIEHKEDVKELLGVSSGNRIISDKLDVGKAALTFFEMQGRGINMISAQSFNRGLSGTKEALEDKVKSLTEERDKAQRLIDAAARGEIGDTGALRQAESTVTRNNAAIEANKNLIELISQRKSFLKELHDQEATAGAAELSGLDRINSKWDEKIRKTKELGIVGKQLADETNAINAARQRELDAENKKLDFQLGLQLRQIQVTEGRARLHIQQEETIQAVPTKQLGTFGVSQRDIEQSIQKQYEARLKNAEAEHQQELTLADELKLENGKTDERAKQVAISKADSALRVSALEAEKDKQKALEDLRQKGIELEKKFLQDYGKLQSGAEAEVIKSRATFAMRIAGLNGKDNPAQVIRDTYQIQITEAQQLYALEVKRISAEEDGYQAALSFEKARKQLVKETSDAQNEAILKQIELEHQQFEGIKKDVEGLYTTLLTKPQEFSRQFQGFIRGAAIKPVAEGLSNLTAGVLRPIIYGEDGTGGIAGATRGLFGQPQVKNPLQLSTDANTTSTDANTAAVVGLTALFAATTGQPEPSAPIGTHTAISIPSFTRSTVGGISPFAGAFPSIAAPLVGGGGGGPLFGSGTAPIGSLVSSSIDFGEGSVPIGSNLSLFHGGAPVTPGFLPGAGGTSDFSLGSVAPAISFPSSMGGTASPPFSIPGIGGSTRGGFSLPSLSALKSSFFNPNINTGAGSAVTADSLGPLGGLAGVLTSPAAGSIMTSVGLPLTTAGLFGVNRGTGTGIAESTFGGALTGAGIGTMILPGIGTLIGAGVGAGVGALASGIEALVGDISPREKAKKYAKQYYGIIISNQAADQIAQIAQSKYAGNVNVAVRSPEVRQMLGLYAAGTGQSNSRALSSLTPHGSALAEQGGVLYQQATYQYGQAYTFQSPLSTLNGISSQTWPSGNSPINLSLNVDGKGAGDFMAGNVVTPGFVNDQLQSANASSMSVTQNAALYQQTPGLITS